MFPGLDLAADEVIGAIQREVPEYARPGDDFYTAAVRRSVFHALHQFAQQIADPAAPREGTVQLFQNIGRSEAAEGRSLEPLQMALRLGARVAWRRLYAAAGRSLGPDVLARIGEAIFLYLDELATACAEGFTQASAGVGGEMERRRRRLLDLLVADPPVSRQAIADRARAAGWPLPRTVAAVVLADRGPGRAAAGPGAAARPLPPGPLSGLVPGLLPALPPDVLIDMVRPDPCLLVPDPDGPGRADLIERGLRGWMGAVGPAVPLARASSSLRWARRALALSRRGIISAGPGVTRCDDHLSTLVLFSDEDLIQGLAGARLAPLDQLRPAQQDTLAETLLAWLQNAGNARETARHLHVHPQTVRYRLRQLHALFGGTLLEPDLRFELEIALRARRLLRGAAPRKTRGGPAAVLAGP
jgi:PucR-like helix-turn-helix protein/diguanylate cyclase with GGDEF domain